MYKILALLLCVVTLSSYTPAKSTPILQKKNQSSSAQLPKWPQELSDTMNQQITMEMQAMVEYLNLAAHFSQLNVSLPHISNFFKDQSDEELGHAKLLINYALSKGGSLNHGPLQPPSSLSSITVLEAFQKALNLEIQVYQSLQNLWKKGDQADIPEFCDWISSTLLDHQVESIAELSRIITSIELAQNDLPMFQVDVNFPSILGSDSSE